jgi:hypothetical protein
VCTPLVLNRTLLCACIAAHFLLASTSSSECSTSFSCAHKACGVSPLSIIDTHLRVFTSLARLSRLVPPYLKLAALLAACIHDIEHRGVTNDFLVKTKDTWADEAKNGELVSVSLSLLPFSTLLS